MKITTRNPTKKYKHLATLALATALLPLTSRAETTNKWTFDASLYGLAAGMSGEAGLGPVNANVDVGFDQVVQNLKFGAMGTVRVGYGRWALSTEIIYLDLEASQGGFTVEAQQWLVQPELEYRFYQSFSVYAGARYNSIDLELIGPPGINPSDTQGWVDPIIGARTRLPLGKKFSFNFTGDIGGFGVGSDLTWQAFPYFDWQFSQHASLQAGYRWLYTDYESGSGLSRFKYEMLTQGPQLGVTFSF
jgi:hypothetical protein